MRRVLLLVVDGCTSRVLGPAMDRGELPVLAELAARGTLNLNCVSIFPSITPAATASIVTGHYPAQHGIAGMSWWNPSTGDVSYLGDDVRTVLNRGIGDFLRGFLVRLNGERLRKPTMSQLVERQGRRAACFNYLMFHGDVAHEVSPPLLLKLLPSVDTSLTVHGPSWLCLGDFVTSGGARDVESSGGPFNRFGMDDSGTEAFLRQLRGVDDLPDFTVAYFADYDFTSHEKGPEAALDVLHTLDGRLAAIFDAWGGVDRVLRDTAIVLTADHAHSEVGGDDGAGIDLTGVLSDYRTGDPAAGWRYGDELLVCPNMRAAEVYVRQPTLEFVAQICRTVLQDTRVDHVIWRAPADDDIHVATADRGSVRFRSAPGRSDACTDEYGGCWDVRGDPGALDMSVDDGRILYGDYPNALERVANGLEHPRAGRLWITARPGYEFQLPGQSVHGRGSSHGTLHAEDSLVPLLLTGSPSGPPLEAQPRIVDVTPWCLDALGLESELRVGQSHG